MTLFVGTNVDTNVGTDDRFTTPETPFPLQIRFWCQRGAPNVGIWVDVAPFWHNLGYFGTLFPPSRFALDNSGAALEISECLIESIIKQLGVLERGLRIPRHLDCRGVARDGLQEREAEQGAHIVARGAL